jgi:ATP-dependent helicase/nuclease subunit A
VNLSPRQQAAVTRTGQDVCVVAGPGSGKTRVLVERFCWLVRERKIPPLRILAVTFTEKAATEIKQRLALEFRTEPLLREQVERAYVSTLHGFCGRLLREHPIAAGLDPEFVIMDDPQSARELQEAAHAALDQLYRERPGELRETLSAIYVSTFEGARQPDMAEALTDIYTALRTAGKDLSDPRRETGQAAGGLTLAEFVGQLRGLLATAQPNTAKQRECLDALYEWLERATALSAGPVRQTHFDLLAQFTPDLRSRLLSPHLKEVRDEKRRLVESTLISEYRRPLKTFLLDALELIHEHYSQRKRELGALDFSDLEEKAIELLRSRPEVLASVRAGFDQVLMDELQDTNPLQWKLIDLVRRPGQFFAVGDINQSIFGFRHAEPEVFRAYRQQVLDSGGEVDELDENHRSRGEILSAVETVFDGVAGVEPRHLRASRPFADKGQPSVEVMEGAPGNKNDAEDAEARLVARRIRELAGSLMIQQDETRQRPARFGDMAILVRTLNALDPMRRALDAFQVPYVSEGGKTFFEEREVKDLVNLVRVIADPADEVALAGVLRSPLVGISDETLLRAKHAGALIEPARLEELDMDADDLGSLRRFAALLAGMRAEKDDVSPDILLARAMDDRDYEGGLHPRARANISKFLALIRNWFHGAPRGLEELVGELEWLRSSESEAEAPPDDSSDAVRLMTMHKAKGREFPIVFLPALHRGTGADDSVICLSSGAELGVCWRNPSTGEKLADLVYLRHAAQTKGKNQGEEDRLLYVAMTRAKEHLVLSFARTERPQGTHWSLVADRLGLSPGTPDDGVAARAAEAAPREAAGEEILLPAPILADQYDSAVAGTSVDLFARCPRRYYLARYLGWQAEQPGHRPGGPESLDAAQFGTLVHALLAGQTVDGAPPEALELATQFQSSDLGKRAARARRLEREFDFVMALDDVVLHGQIDLWFEDGDRLVLVDYKTDAVRREDAAEHAQSYAHQLRLYAMALHRMTGRLPDEALVCLLRTGQVIPISVDPFLLDQTRQVVRDLRNAQDRPRFELREGQQCQRCPFYRGLCPAPTARPSPPSSARERP